MSYLKPITMVYQEYASTSVSTKTASLIPCIIGPAYHIIDEVNDAVLAETGVVSNGVMAATAIPNNAPGAIIESSSITVRFGSTRASLYPIASPKSVNSVADNTISYTSGNFPTDAKVGDIVTIKDSTQSLVGTEYRVTSIDATGFTLYLNKTPDLTGTTAPYTSQLEREVADFTQVVGGAVSFDPIAETISIIGLTVDIDSTLTNKEVTSAKVFTGYKALRQDLSNINSVSNTTEAEGILGKLVSGNPLGYGVMVTLANTNTEVKFIGVQTNDLAGYTAAKDRLETYTNIYSMVPLTQDSSIINVFKTHAEAYSVPTEGKWRVCIGSTALVTSKTLGSGSGVLTTDASSQPTIIFDSSATFITSGVNPGDKITVGGTDYTVDTVISEDRIQTTNPMSGTVGNSYTYSVVQELTKDQQSLDIAATSSSFGYQRMIHVWPSVCSIGGVDEPGYYLACTVAGMTAGLPSQQGFTRISVAGIDGVKYSSDYFNGAQLDTIAGGGTFIFVQDSPTAAPYVRHQLTTDTSTIEMQEFSFVKNFDYVSMLCQDVLNKFLGKYNITPETLGILQTAVEAILESQKIASLPKIGSPIIAYKVVSVAQLDTIRDRAEIYVDVTFPYPLNTIGLHLVSK